jgi:hypothetical protein
MMRWYQETGRRINGYITAGAPLNRDLFVRLKDQRRYKLESGDKPKWERMTIPGAFLLNVRGVVRF